MPGFVKSFIALPFLVVILQTIVVRKKKERPKVMDWLDEALADRRDRSLMRKLRVRPVERARDFSSNDYLALRHDPRLHLAGIEAAALYGSGAGSSPAVSGWTTAHETLAKEMAGWKEAEGALLFSSGYVANQSTVAALVGTGDVIYADRLSHACLIDGARLSGATLKVFPHNDLGRLETVLNRDQGRYRRRLIITESIFSMDGDAAPLVELAALAERFQAMMVVDEAHATGLFGAHGAGMVESLGLGELPFLVRLGTLSKAVGVQGGFVVGSQKLIDWLVQSARGWIYSTAISPYLAGAAEESIRIIREEPWRRVQALQMADSLRQELRKNGWNVAEGVGPIVPLILGDVELALKIGQKLEDQGFAVGVIRPPTVPKGTARLRISVNAGHTLEDIGRLVDALVISVRMD